MDKQYEKFLLAKHNRVNIRGFDYDASSLPEKMFRFQRDSTMWAIKLGKAAINANVGMGKTLMQLSYANAYNEYTGKPSFVLTPLAVAGQTMREAQKFGIKGVVYRRDETEIASDDKIILSNYERIDKFPNFVRETRAVVLDEASRIKNYNGATKRLIFEAFNKTPYKLECSATPAPNSYMEIGQHAEFLDVMESNIMLMNWFRSTDKAGVYRLKNYAEDDFWRWLTSWAICITKPSDLGAEYADEDKHFQLPPLNIIGHFIGANQEAITEAWRNGYLLPNVNPSSTDLPKAKRMSLQDRVKVAQEIVSSIDNHEPIVIWTTYDNEGIALRQVIPEAIEIHGSDKLEVKEDKLLGFTNGDIRILITKGKITGHGLNWQHSANVIDFSPTFSFETFYQQKGRNHRFGQTREVNYHIIYAETEGNVMESLNRKQMQYSKMQSKMTAAMKHYGLFRDESMFKLKHVAHQVHNGKNYEMHLGDCVELIKKIPDNSIHLSVYSPPYAELFIYSDGMADMGNSNSDTEFFEHYRYLVREKFRVTLPGRITAIHVKDLPMYKNNSEWFGVKPFSDECVRLHLEEGWVFHSRIMIWKSPVEEMEKTNSHGMLHKSFVQRTQVCRVGLPDYVLLFVKPDPENMGTNIEKNPYYLTEYIGDNPPAQWEREVRSKKPKFYKGSIEEYNNSIAVWQRFASPVWFDIRHTNVLNFEIAKGNTDERHICPMPLDLYGRIIQIWSNSGETVLEPFAGIGSGIASALHLKRRAIGFELKESYWQWAIKFADEAEREVGQKTMFDLLDEYQQKINVVLQG